MSRREAAPNPGGDSGELGPPFFSVAKTPQAVVDSRDGWCYTRSIDNKEQIWDSSVGNVPRPKSQ